MRRFVIVFLAIAAARQMGGQLQAEDLRVPEGFKALSDALAASRAGDRIVVGPGHYSGAFVVGEGRILCAAKGPSVTVLDGEGAGNVVTLLNAKLEGFTVTGGGESGSGVVCVNSATVSNCIVTRNEGNGVLHHCAGALITNNIVTENGRHGVRGYAFTPICNNIIARNGKAGISVLPGVSGRLVIRGNDVWGNARQYGGAWEDSGGLTGSNGNISEDPGFASPGTGDYTLRPDSPCVDSGDNDAEGLSSRDGAGKVRISDGDCDGIPVVDMGPYELVPPAVDVTHAE